MWSGQLFGTVSQVWHRKGGKKNMPSQTMFTSASKACAWRSNISVGGLKHVIIMVSLKMGQQKAGDGSIGPPTDSTVHMFTLYVHVICSHLYRLGIASGLYQTPKKGVKQTKNEKNIIIIIIIIICSSSFVHHQIKFKFLVHANLPNWILPPNGHPGAPRRAAGPRTPTWQGFGGLEDVKKNQEIWCKKCVNICKMLYKMLYIKWW